jgi:hypothetical protein
VTFPAFLPSYFIFFICLFRDLSCVSRFKDSRLERENANHAKSARNAAKTESEFMAVVHRFPSSLPLRDDTLQTGL